MPPGVAWLGPSPEAIDQMGCKIRSKLLALQAGVSVIPGFEGELTSLDYAIEVANDIGYPVLLKAASGGGGKGMRICRSDVDVHDFYPLAKSEALNFFNDDRLLMEKYVENPHHIEFQLLSGKNPTTGNLDVLVFCERECSIQRRHQKILEESPSPLLTEETRLKMVQQVKQLVHQVGYESAGTVEFLVDEEQNFYFLEMNTRLQVEHPVTESVSVGDLDLVKGMLWVGAGWGVPQEYLDTLGDDNPYYPHHGHAIEARVYAEDPLRGFLPSTGPLVPYQEPTPIHTPGDRLLRVDSGVAEGHVVTPHYDPMLSKVVAWSSAGRQAALDQLHQAMQEYVIGGGDASSSSTTIQHNGRLVMDVVAHPAFSAGKTPTSFLDTHYPEGFQGVTLTQEDKENLAVCMVVLEQDTRPAVVVRLGGMFGEALKVERMEKDAFKVTSLLEDGSEQRIIQLDEVPSYKPSDLLANVSLDGGKTTTTIQMLSQLSTGEVGVEMKGADMNVLIQSEREYELSKHMHPPKEVDTSDMVLSPMPGALVSYAVEAGDVVEIGQELCVVEAMKMQNIIRSPRAGTIANCRVSVGSALKTDEVILDFVVDTTTDEDDKVAA